MGVTETPEEMLANYWRHRLLTIFNLFIAFDYVFTLKILDLHVPAHVALGTRAHLFCRWALGPAEVLYSVKWYKDGKEFFRHVPRDQEPQRKFPLPGVHVEQWDSSGSDIVLSSAVSETAGRYRCEVSGERPLFPTVSGHKDMAVVVLPDHGPYISKLRTSYHVGDHVGITCTSGRSTPPLNLSWYLNGEPVASSKKNYKVINGEQMKRSTHLDFTVKEQHFKNGVIRIKCLATLGSIYWQSDEKSTLLDRSQDEKEVKLHQMNTRADRIHTSSDIASVQVFSNLTLILISSLVVVTLNKLMSSSSLGS